MCREDVRGIKKKPNAPESRMKGETQFWHGFKRTQIGIHMRLDKYFQLLFGAFFDYVIITRLELTGSTRYANGNQSYLSILNKMYKLSFSAFFFFFICSIFLFYGNFLFLKPVKFTYKYSLGFFFFLSTHYLFICIAYVYILNLFNCQFE